MNRKFSETLHIDCACFGATPAGLCANKQIRDQRASLASRRDRTIRKSSILSTPRSRTLSQTSVREKKKKKLWQGGPRLGFHSRASEKVPEVAREDVACETRAFVVADVYRSAAGIGAASYSAVEEADWSSAQADDPETGG